MRLRRRVGFVNPLAKPLLKGLSNRGGRRGRPGVPAHGRTTPRDGAGSSPALRDFKPRHRSLISWADTATAITARGYSGNAVRDGDSGGFAFSCNGSRTNPRIARGMVSGDYLGDNGLMAFTWGESILSYYGKTVYWQPARKRSEHEQALLMHH